MWHRHSCLCLGKVQRLILKPMSRYTAQEMGDLSEFSFVVRAFLKAYRWRRIDPIPWTPLRKPLAAANVAIVTTAGLVMPDQEPFDDDVKGGDSSFRVIPAEADVSSLIDTHRSETFDHSGIRADPNLSFPLDRKSVV